MTRDISWEEVLLDFEAGGNELDLREKIFAVVKGWDWPLYGTPEEVYCSNPGTYDYIGNADIATEAAIEMFRNFVWDQPDWEPEITMTRENGAWTAKIGIDAEHAAAVSDGALTAAVELGGTHETAGGAIMKSAIGLRALFRRAREAVPDDPVEP